MWLARMRVAHTVIPCKTCCDPETCFCVQVGSGQKWIMKLHIVIVEPDQGGVGLMTESPRPLDHSMGRSILLQKDLGARGIAVQCKGPLHLWVQAPGQVGNHEVIFIRQPKQENAPQGADHIACITLI
ncbi:hypothetical protein [Roseinatronobacter sp. NSM]|uniref:hypothetical protein n=1 Tax=Roseinatronobacter sp. NSM TaxID=3457785 RepID=UPI004035D490